MYPKINMVKRCWFSQNNVFHQSVLSHNGSMFCFFPPSQTRIVLFSVNEEAFPNWNFCPTVFQKNFLELPFSQVLPVNDRTDSAQEERLDLPYWTMILAICVLVDAYPNIWTFRLWNLQQWWCIFHFDLGVSWYCVCCLSCASWQSWYDIHYYLQRSFVTPMIPAQ